MRQHEPLTLSLDDTLDISFADDLLSQFDLKRDLLNSTNTTVSNDSIKSGNHNDLLTISDSYGNNKFTQTPPSILPLPSQYQVDSHRLKSAMVTQNTATMAATPDPLTILAPEINDNVALNTTLPLPLTTLDTPHIPTNTYQRHYDTSLDSKVKPKSTTASLPGTIADRAHRRRQNGHNLLRRSSTYLRQKFFAGANANDTTVSPPPPLPTIDPILPQPLNDSEQLAKTVTPDHISDNQTHDRGSKTTSPLSPPPTPPTSSIPIIPSSPSTSPSSLPLPPPPPTNPDMAATGTTMIAPVISPCQYPPKPLQYCPVDPPSDDRHRASFPIFWRKKYLKEPRRQSEPTITSDHIKTRRSFFFL